MRFHTGEVGYSSQVNVSQNCDETGLLRISECPTGKLWDQESRSCVESSEICKPERQWTEQSNVDLVDCIGYLDGRCQLGFVELNQAKKYCENDEICVGVKQVHCNRVAVDLDCVGEYWRPYKESEPSEANTVVHMVIKNSKVEEIGADDQDQSSTELRVS